MDLRTWWPVTAGLSQSSVLEPKGRGGGGRGRERTERPSRRVGALPRPHEPLPVRGGVLGPAEVKS